MTLLLSYVELGRLSSKPTKEFHHEGSPFTGRLSR